MSSKLYMPPQPFLSGKGANWYLCKRRQVEDPQEQSASFGVEVLREKSNLDPQTCRQVQITTPHFDLVQITTSNSKNRLKHTHLKTNQSDPGFILPCHRFLVASTS